MTIAGAPLGRAEERLFPRWTGRPAPNAAESGLIETTADPDIDALAAVIDQIIETLGASGAMLVLNGSSGTRLLFSSAPGEARWPRLQPSGDHAKGARASNPGMTLEWRSSPEADETWLLANEPADFQGSEWVSLAFRFDRLSCSQKAVVEEAVAGIAALVAGFLRLWTLNERSARRVDALASALDQSDVGVLLLDRRARIVFENREATTLLDARDGIRRRNRTLGASSLADAVQLQVAINHVLACGEDSDSPDDCATVVALHREGGRRPLLVSATAAHGEIGGEVAVMVSLFDPEHDLRPLMEPACTLYGLSPAETRLACLIAHGESLADAAKALRIREHTARSYLKQIFIKTDTNRQADLVRLMLTSTVRSNHVPRFEVV